MAIASPECSQVKQKNKFSRIAWLLQGAGAYYQPLMSEFTQLFPQTTVFTADWSGFMVGFEDSIAVKCVGTIQSFSLPSFTKKGFGNYFTFLSPKIVTDLIQFKPEVIFSTGFSLWTTLALLSKPLHSGKVVIVYDGSAPGVDFQGSRLRLLHRRILARLTDAFITNTEAGKVYLTKTVKAEPKKVFARPYLVPHPKTYAPYLEKLVPNAIPSQHPIFTCVGQLIPRKGVLKLLEACQILQSQGIGNYKLLILGDGEQRSQLEAFVKTHQLENQIEFAGNIQYEYVGAYFQKTDVFVFPTLEDVWGMVTVEAMMFGKPILCSKWAGTAELMRNGENGYVFNPYEPEKLAKLIGRFIDNPDLIKTMGEKSKQIMDDYTPEVVANFLSDVVKFVLKDRHL